MGRYIFCFQATNKKKTFRKLQKSELSITLNYGIQSVIVTHLFKKKTIYYFLAYFGIGSRIVTTIMTQCDQIQKFFFFIAELNLYYKDQSNFSE